ncbi:MAG: ATP-binding protein [Trueperaceae bacterium]|nr:ATP-binding protein [Trueperaceae bacterium]
MSYLGRQQPPEGVARALLITAAACAVAIASLAFLDIVIITRLSIVAILMAVFYGISAGLASFALVLVVRSGVTFYTPLLSETLHTLSATSLQVSTGLNLALGLLALAFAGQLRSRFDQTLAESAERELRYRSLLETIPDAIIRYDREGYYREVIQPNDFTGLRSSSELERRRIDEMLPPDVAQQVLSKIERGFVTGELQTLEHPLTVAGELRYREVRLIAMNEREGIAIVRDITEQTRQAQQLRESEARHRALLEVIPDAIISHDRAGRYVEIIQPTEFTLLDPNAAATGRSVNDVLPAKAAADVRQKLAQTFATGELQIIEHPLMVRGEKRYREVRFLRVSDHEAVAIIRDITERKRAELALTEANRHKSEFLATMSHELRTPLTSILGFSEILTEEYFGPLNDKQVAYVRDIHDSGQHLLSLINDILDLSKIEAGKLELYPETIDLHHLAESALRVVKERAHKQGIELTHCTLPASSHPSSADARNLRQMLFNYLSNAIKFTPEGGSIALHIEGTDDEVRFEVVDTGVGIAPKDRHKLFKSFSQVDSSLTRSHMGTGLGLSLVKQLAELHGGRVWVKSEVGVGSTFGFSVSRGLLETDDAARVVSG